MVDEADHMADLGFLPGVTRILAATPAGGQRLLFSATLDNGVDKLVKRFLRNPVTHSVDEAHSPVPEMTHHVFHVTESKPRRNWCTSLPPAAADESCSCAPSTRPASWPRSSRNPACRQSTCTATFLSPRATATLRRSATGKARVLVATDIAARGVHVDEVELVVHVDPPTEHKAYLHRSGRTARAGNTGDVVTVVLARAAQGPQVLMRRAGINVRPQEVAAHTAPVTALVGDIAPRRIPAPRTDPSPNSASATTGESRRPRNPGVRRRSRGGDARSARTQHRGHAGRRRGASA